MDQVQKRTLIALKGRHQMVSISADLVVVDRLRRTPHEPTFIPCHKLMKPILWMGQVTIATPDRVTGLPVSPGALKVGAKEAFRPFLLLPTHLAIPDPKPERKGIA